MKASEKCKICQLEKSHESVFKSINKSIINIESGKLKKSMASVIRGINEKYGTGLTPMNASRHKAHFLTETIEIKKEDITKTPPTEVYSQSGDLQYTNAQEIIDSMEDRHRSFSEAYVHEFNHNQRKAYKSTYDSDMTDESARANASRLIANDSNNVAWYIKYLNHEKSKRIMISPSFVIDGYQEIYDRCMGLEAVMDKSGEYTGNISFMAKEANKALEMIGKSIQMWDKKEQPTDQTLYKKILEDFISNKLNPLTASVELEKAGIEMPELLKIALRKVDPSIIEQPPTTEGMHISELSDEELNNLEIQNES